MIAGYKNVADVSALCDNLPIFLSFLSHIKVEIYILLHLFLKDSVGCSNKDKHGNKLEMQAAFLFFFYKGDVSQIAS